MCTIFLLYWLDSASKLENSVIVRTAAKPVAGECHVNPKSGIAGTTLFTVTCSEFHDVYGDEALSYYYYERYESDQDELGKCKRVDYSVDLLENVYSRLVFDSLQLGLRFVDIIKTK